MAEALRFHKGLDRRAATARVADLLASVGLPDPAGTAERYPHELSGGMRQRVMIAMALACEPSLLIADEPTTALDVTVQAQILDLLRTLVRDRGMALLLITHDLGVVRELCERAIVLYAGRVAEQAPVRDLLRTPLHPYTSGLAASIPSIRDASPAPAPDLGHAPGPCRPAAGLRLRGTLPGGHRRLP